jgi:hypothetical protein
MKKMLLQPGDRDLNLFSLVIELMIFSRDRDIVSLISFWNNIFNASRCQISEVEMPLILPRQEIHNLRESEFRNYYLMG